MVLLWRSKTPFTIIMDCHRLLFVEKEMEAEAGRSNSMKILITGGAGFIGSHLAGYLSGSHSVVILDDLSGGSEDNISKVNCQFVRGSILDHQLVNSLFDEHRFEYVYHLASYAAENLSNFVKRYTHMVNVMGSVNLLNASVNYNAKCFVFTSSIAVYGSGQGSLPRRPARGTRGLLRDCQARGRARTRNSQESIRAELRDPPSA